MAYKQGPAWWGSFSLISYWPRTPSLTDASGTLASFLFVEHIKPYQHLGPCTCGTLYTYLSVLSPNITSSGAFASHRLEKQSPFPSFHLLDLSQSVAGFGLFICFSVCGLCYCLSHPYLECEVLPSLNSSILSTKVEPHIWLAYHIEDN